MEPYTVAIIEGNVTTFASVSYTAVPEENTDRPAPEYDEIIDDEMESSNLKAAAFPVPAEVKPESNEYCGTPRQADENDNICIIVR